MNDYKGIRFPSKVALFETKVQDYHMENKYPAYAD